MSGKHHKARKKHPWKPDLNQGKRRGRPSTAKELRHFRVLPSNGT